LTSTRIAAEITSMNRDNIITTIAESIRVKQAMLDRETDAIARIAELCVSASKAGRTLFFCGNGGSFTDAQHIVGELIGRFGYDRPGLAAVTLGSNFASLTAIGNDYGYEDVFVREVDGLVRRGDVVIGLSTSGGSKNVIKAFRRAKDIGATCIGLTGDKRGTPMDELCDAVLHVPSLSTPRIQECHILVGHLIAQAVEEAMYPRA